MNADKVIVIAEGIGLDIVDWDLFLEYFHPDDIWTDTGMVLEWLEEKCVRHEWSIGINRDYSTETTHQVTVRSECFDIVVKGEGSTLQEAICEAALKVITN